MSSALFALVHVPSRLDEIADRPVILPIMVLSHFGFGVFMCRVRVATGSIWWPTAIHTLSNFATYAYLWGALGSGWWMGTMKIGWNAVGLLLAVSLPMYEEAATGRLPFLLHRERIARGLLQPKLHSRWSLVVRGRVVGGMREPIPGQQRGVRQASPDRG